jgi:hypothetical protein
MEVKSANGKVLSVGDKVVAYISDYSPVPGKRNQALKHYQAEGTITFITQTPGKNQKWYVWVDGNFNLQNKNPKMQGRNWYSFEDAERQIFKF